PGVIVAGPTRSYPDYFYDWVRDSALVWKTLVKVWDSGLFPALRAEIPALAEDFVKAQSVMQRNGAGEPKHNVDLSKYEGEWGRPQNDGPGLRMQVLTELLDRDLLKGDSIDLALRVIERDRIYVDKAINSPDIEPWEEVQGYHLYNRLQIAKGAFDAAQLFSKDGKFAGRYDSALYMRLHNYILPMLQDHFKNTEFIKPTYRTGRMDSKYTDLDITVLLAHLHADFPTWWEVAVDDSRLLGSVVALIQSFDDLYPVNQQGLPGTMTGRYPEDVYDGVGFGGGNAWFLSTLAIGEYFQRLVDHWNFHDQLTIDHGNISQLSYVVNRYYPGVKLYPGSFKRGQGLSGSPVSFDLVVECFQRFSTDQLRRTLFHIADDGSMSEQSSRYDGYMRGAPNLSWSYGAYLRTYLERIK
ncbi:hypothetical protein GW915_09615, partial [bacterium]|nr:hypothetical protein [bacterium]